MTTNEVIKEARLLAKSYGTTLKKKNIKINNSQAYMIIDRKSGRVLIDNMTLVSAWETLLDGRFFDKKDSK